MEETLHIGFIGLGLIGGSIARSIKRFHPDYQIYAYTRTEATLDQAMAEGIVDVKCSKALEDEIKKLGGIPIQYRTGNSYLRNKVNKDNIPFGGEYSGHLMFNDKFMGFDSGMYAGLRMIEILSRTSKKLSELLDGVNKYYSTEELKFNSPDDIKFEVINKLIKDYPECLTIDGMKMVYDDGFALVRASNTGPTITARFEATTRKRLEELQKEFVDKINLYNKK